MIKYITQENVKELEFGDILYQHEYYDPRTDKTPYCIFIRYNIYGVNNNEVTHIHIGTPKEGYCGLHENGKTVFSKANSNIPSEIKKDANALIINLILKRRKYGIYNT